ncbi:MAG: serine/threonine protein kinase [Acidobacteriia bacterium]|nr:serine/threonine protein kinase [Terriglobia bacterium]
MGAVYEAEDQVLGRRIALKMLPRELCSDRSALDRFQREARAASALNHPNICTIYEISEWEGDHFIALELLEGDRLRDRIVNRALPLNDVLDFGIQIADALNAAHRKGVVHRDITPSNIFLTRNGQAKLLDFGLAKLVVSEEAVLNSSVPTSPSDSALTSKGTTMGTIGYMSPEQARGQEIDARSDLFSFGAVLYEMATGKQAFPGNTSAVIFDSILNRSPLPLARVNPALPPALDPVVFRALEKDRELRYQTAAELRADLRRMKRDLDSSLSAPSSSSSQVPAAVPRGSSRHLSAQGLPIVNRQPLRWLLAALQLMYLVFYVAALAQLEDIHRFAQIVIPGSGWGLPAVVLVTACIGIAVRLYLLSSIAFDHPELGKKFRSLFFLLLPLDQLWALSPLLLVTRIGLGLAFGAMAALLYCPFSQRTLVRMAYPVVVPPN